MVSKAECRKGGARPFELKKKKLSFSSVYITHTNWNEKRRDVDHILHITHQIHKIFYFTTVLDIVYLLKKIRDLP